MEVPLSVLLFVPLFVLVVGVVVVDAGLLVKLLNDVGIVVVGDVVVGDVVETGVADAGVVFVITGVVSAPEFKPLLVDEDEPVDPAVAGLPDRLPIVVSSGSGLALTGGDGGVSVLQPVMPKTINMMKK